MKHWLKESLTKQLVLFSAGIMASLLMAFFITVGYVKNNVEKNILDLNGKILLQIEGKLDDYYDKMNHIAMVLSYSPTTKKYFDQNDRERVVSISDVQTEFSNIMLLEDDIVGITLCDIDGKQIASIGKEAEQELPITNLGNKIAFGNLFYSNQSGAPYYVVYCPVFDLESQQFGKKIGINMLIMKTDGLKDFLMDSEATQNSEIYLLDGSDRVIAQSGNNRMAEYLAKQQESGKDYLVQNMDTVMEGWHIVSRIPQKELAAGHGEAMGLIVIAYVVAGLLICMLICFCYRNFVKRVNHVDSFIRKLSDNPEERMTEERNDEIGRVIRNLNQMLNEKEKMNREIQESQKRMYEIELAKKQLQILAYRNQINPHFLYNTFECIRGMALYHDMDEIAEITMALSKVFRFAVKEDNIVAVEEEVNYIREYATIIDYRFMGKIHVDIDVENELYPRRVIKLMLQPLVENAVFHGLEQKMGDGTVTVTVRRKWDDFIMFMVEDNGCGISQEKLEQLRNSLDKEMSGKGIGLANIYQRLRLFYGDDVVFEIKSEPDKGTRVMVVVPDHVEEK